MHKRIGTMPVPGAIGQAFLLPPPACLGGIIDPAADAAQRRANAERRLLSVVGGPYSKEETRQINPCYGGMMDRYQCAGPFYEVAFIATDGNQRNTAMCVHNLEMIPD
jgi:hypothetical protein